MANSRIDDDTPRCDGCMQWRRLKDYRGLCWHPATHVDVHPPVVYEDGACPRYEARIIVVRRQVAVLK